jgi:hypothetical protein
MSGGASHDRLLDIRNDVRATIRLSFDKLLQLGYSRDAAQALLVRMTRAVAGQLDDRKPRSSGPAD